MANMRSRIRAITKLVRGTINGNLLPRFAPSIPEEGVLIAPANSAGQAHLWARALETAAPEVAAVNMQFVSDDVFQFRSDATVHAIWPRYSKWWQQKQLQILSKYRGVIIESNRGPLGDAFGGSVPEQVRALQSAGVKVALMFHGSDIRAPEPHIAREPDSYFAVDRDFTKTFSDVTARSQRTIAECGVQVFVSTNDLLTDVPSATWVPVVVNPQQWQGGGRPLADRGKPCVVHVPSKTLIKGTELIEPTMRKLHAEGVIDYTSVTGVPHTQMPDLYRGADIVLDQFRGAPYGVAACEAMASGRIVVSHVPYRERTREITGLDVPIIEASAGNLEQTIRDIIAHPDRARSRAAAGQSYVATVHNGALSGKRLAAWLTAEEG